MTKSTFMDISFFGVLNWVTVHSQTEKYVKIIATPCDGKVEHARVFQKALQGWEENYGGGRWEILVWAAVFSASGKNLLRSDLDHLIPFQS